MHYNHIKFHITRFLRDEQEIFILKNQVHEIRLSFFCMSVNMSKAKQA